MGDSSGAGMAAAIPVIGGAAGYILGQKERDQAAKDRQAAIDAFANIKTPTPEELAIQLTDFIMWSHPISSIGAT